MYYKPKFINFISEDILLHLIHIHINICYSFNTYWTELKSERVHEGTPRIGQFLLYLKVTVKCLVILSNLSFFRWLLCNSPILVSWKHQCVVQHLIALSYRDIQYQLVKQELYLLVFIATSIYTTAEEYNLLVGICLQRVLYLMIDLPGISLQ